MSDSQQPKRNPTIAARVDMVNGMFPLPDETIQGMKEIRAIFQRAANELEAVSESGVKLDVGRMIAAVDLIQQAKNTACDSLILPHHVKK